MKKALARLKQLSLTKKVLLGFGTIVFLSAVGSPAGTETKLATQNASSVATQSQTPIQTEQIASAPSVKKETTYETSSVPFESTTINDSSLAAGQTKLVVNGVNGVRTDTYETVYTDGVAGEKKFVTSAITTSPVVQVTNVGTYVAPVATSPTCPNGTYINSAGNSVCSPYESSGVPAGATAQCRDGSYSFSQSRSGTCSHHGGVASWL